MQEPAQDGNPSETRGDDPHNAPVLVHLRPDTDHQGNDMKHQHDNQWGIGIRHDDQATQNRDRQDSFQPATDPL